MHTILLVDDDPQTRRIFGLALRQRGYHLIEAESGLTGLEAAKKYLPDLILTDVNMPEGDGPSLLYHIRQSPELKAKQVVLMTGYTDIITPRRAMEEGADDFLLKPFTMEALFSCVEARLRRADIHWRVEDRNLDKLRSSLLSTLPHELFTPLAGMMGLSEYLHANATVISLDEMQALHGDIYNAGLRLQRSLTKYFRILALESEPPLLANRTRLEPAEVRTVIQDGIDAVITSPGPPRNVVLKAADIPIFIQSADLKAIVEELVDNARKFSGIGTEISVCLEKNGVLTVSNLGREMSAEQIQQVGAFQHFDRNKQAEQGLGLGLILAQKLTERNGAKFSIESQPGQGTTVSVIFSGEKRGLKIANGAHVN